MRNKVVATFLLAAIVIYGGALRFTGQNWDDFSHTHPDELFLTRLVLPNLGGGNSFTADESQFPEQQILALRDSAASINRADIAISHPLVWASYENRLPLRPANGSSVAIDCSFLMTSAWPRAPC